MLLLSLIHISLAEAVEVLDVRLAHLVQNMIDTVLGSHLELTADVVFDQLLQKGGIGVGVEVVLSLIHISCRPATGRAGGAICFEKDGAKGDGAACRPVGGFGEPPVSGKQGSLLAGAAVCSGQKQALSAGAGAPPGDECLFAVACTDADDAAALFAGAGHERAR